MSSSDTGSCFADSNEKERDDVGNGFNAKKITPINYDCIRLAEGGA
jgi:hypothetical protein